MLKVYMKFQNHRHLNYAGRQAGDKMKNIYNIPSEIQTGETREFVETILGANEELYVERIISQGQATGADKWYDQDHDEWVVVLKGQAKIQYRDGTEVTLGEGDHLFLPKHMEHRVSYTSAPCIWLAVHGRELERNCRSSADLKA